MKISSYGYGVPNDDWLSIPCALNSPVNISVEVFALSSELNTTLEYNVS